MMAVIVPTLLLWIISFFNQFGVRENSAGIQLLFYTVGLIVFVLVRYVGRRFFVSNASFFYWATVILMVVTYIVGIEVKGSKRWIDLGFVNIQPSEFFKVFFVLYYAKVLAQPHLRDMSMGSYVWLLVRALIPVGIIFLQPDLGNAMVFVVVFAFLLLLSEIPKKYMMRTVLAVLSLMPFAWFLLKEYQRNRILSFLAPQDNAGSHAYNVIQSVITVGSGGMWGKGLGRGTQSRLFFLPENTTDFAFASLVEQFGMSIGMLVIALECALVVALLVRALKFAGQQDVDSRFKSLYAAGIACVLLFQAGVNIGMNMGVVPVAGIALPFISAGGSFVVAFTMGLALLKSRL